MLISVLCMTKDSNNIMKSLQIFKIPISWIKNQNPKIWINDSLYIIIDDFSK